MTETIANEIAVAIGSADVDNPALGIGLALAQLTNLPLRLIHVVCDGDTVDTDVLQRHLESVAPKLSVSVDNVVADTVSDRATSNDATSNSDPSNGDPTNNVVVNGIVNALTDRSLAVLKSTNANRWSGKASVAEHVLDAFSGLVAMIGPNVAAKFSLNHPILVALDGSPNAERALSVTRYLAGLTEQEVIMATVLSTSADDGERATATKYLDALGDTLDTSRSTLPISNDPISALTAVAVEAEASLIVLSSHGDRTSERPSISRTSMGLVHSAPVPVLLVGARAS